MKDWDWPISITCDLCGKPMYVPLKNEWAYKAPTPLRMRKPGMAEVQYFCHGVACASFRRKWNNCLVIGVKRKEQNMDKDKKEFLEFLKQIVLEIGGVEDWNLLDEP